MNTASLFICTMTIPPSLEPGAEIRLIAPSRWVDESLVEQAESELRKMGYTPSRSANLLARNGQLAGTDAERAHDFLAAWHNPNVKAIWAMRGGYGAQRILPRLAVELDDSVRKWFIGFSDSTAIHGLLTNKGCPSLHAAMWSTLGGTLPSHVQSTFEILNGFKDEVAFKPHAKDVQGTAKGRLVGGNLSVLQTMIGTSSFPLRSGDILFIEDLDEMLYHLDRMLLHIGRSGSLAGLAGILVGGMSDMRDNTISHGFSTDNPFGGSVEDILSEHLCGLGIPVGMAFQAGHGEANHPLVLGVDVKMSVEVGGNRLTYL